MNFERIWAIARKDWREVRRNRSAWLPMVIVPLIFVVVLPAGLLLAAGSDLEYAQMAFNDPELELMLRALPPAMTAYLDGLDLVQSGIVLFLGYLFAPFFLIMPIMFAAVIAAESFAGELERKTLEALLYTPVRDSELFLGKVLAAGVPAFAVTLFSFLGYTLVVNGLGWPVMGRVWFPLPAWYPLIFWVTPAISALGIGATVLISARVKTFMGAYQLSGSLVLVVLALLVGQATGVLYLGVAAALIIGAVLWVIAAALLAVGIRTFRRSTILVKG
ncbi:MAG TPA: ABC transporter permease subunit [Chloroflexi bacterium]|nr:ABC transporter permease subunit [Chloroflexota bacterium]HPO58650.1 ABC transporter permease subunit [Anaerolineaceae bacterium]